MVLTPGQMVNGQALYTVNVRAIALDARARAEATAMVDFIVSRLRGLDKQ
jgi:hypothetical protein